MVKSLMSLTLKDPEIQRLAEELAKRTGLSTTDAVTLALREKLALIAANEKANDNEDRAETIKRRFDAMLADAKAISGRLPPGTRALDIDTLLYDDAGMPK
jgi:hypothetical protein